MAEVRYSINGKYFKDFSLIISESDGLFDALKMKKINSYDWPEYHGYAADLSSPKFEAREISLKGFVTGDNWLDLKSNFDAVVLEFQKPGTQRLMIEPFGMKPLIYEAYMEGSAPLEKAFKDGKMVGTFTLKLIEPNPIKKIYRTEVTDTYFQFYTPKWATIFWGDSTESVRGNVDINRDYSLAPEKDRVKVDYNIWGIFYKIATYSPNRYHFFTKAKFSTPGLKTMYLVGKHHDKTYSLLAEVSVTVGTVFASFDIPFTCTPTDYARFFLKMSEDCEMKDTSVYTTDWEATAFDGYIVIAGNIDEFSPVTTNADLVWEKL